MELMKTFAVLSLLATSVYLFKYRNDDYMHWCRHEPPKEPEGVIDVQDLYQYLGSNFCVELNQQRNLVLKTENQIKKVLGSWLVIHRARDACHYIFPRYYYAVKLFYHDGKRYIMGWEYNK